MYYNYLLTELFLNNQFTCEEFNGGAKRGTKKWNSFCHNGLEFPPEYKEHNIPVIYDNEKIHLDIRAEELATLYARYIESDYIKNKTFRKNFWKDWKKVLGENHIIKDFDKCNFRLIYEHLINEKEKRKQLTKEEKQKLKEERQKKQKKYTIALVDGVEQSVGNFRVEPPTIFMGRGCHPKMGKVKKRIMPEDITINIDKECAIPKSLLGHNWGRIIHDNTVEWIASWYEPITGKTKYVWLGNNSKFKAQSDINKFNLAKKLKSKIKRIRKVNEENMHNKDIKLRQIATAMYFIDYMALRVGNEKGDDKADTVGVTSLRVEHVELMGNNKMKLDFLGKDSIRYIKTFIVCPPVYNNLSEFMQNKSGKEQLFDKINSQDINKYLQSFMKDLTAKVFRTFNASYLFQKEINKISKKAMDIPDDDTQKINMLLNGFNKANIKVAILCNHQKQVSKTFKQQIERIDEQIKNQRKRLRKIKKIKKNEERIKKIKDKIAELKARKDMKIQLKSISLETSKANYIDPRITVAFIKRHNLDINKIFSKALQNKFQWAFEVDENYKF